MPLWKGCPACLLVPCVAQSVTGFFCDAYCDASSQQGGGGGRDTHPPNYIRHCCGGRELKGRAAVSGERPIGCQRQTGFQLGVMPTPIHTSKQPSMNARYTPTNTHPPQMDIRHAAFASSVSTHTYYIHIISGDRTEGGGALGMETEPPCAHCSDHTFHKMGATIVRGRVGVMYEVRHKGWCGLAHSNGDFISFFLQPSPSSSRTPPPPGRVTYV